MIGIVDYGLGNLTSVRNSVRAVGGNPVVSSEGDLLSRVDGLVLPGVGAARAGMERLRAVGLDRVVVEAVGAGVPILGICLGMQLLFDGSSEGDVACLGLLPGRVRLLCDAPKLPHIGWNQVHEVEPAEMWAGLPPDPYVYFVHSYACEPYSQADVVGVTTYGETFCSAVARGSIWGTQFHPERSGTLGLRILHNFVDSCSRRSDRPS